MLEPSGVLVYEELDVCAAVPQDVAARVAPVVGQPRQDDDALGQQPERHVFGQQHFGPENVEVFLHKRQSHLKIAFYSKHFSIFIIRRFYKHERKISNVILNFFQNSVIQTHANWNYKCFFISIFVL